jgi:hypothetical protein
MVTIPHVGTFVIPYFVNHGMILATFLFASAYLVNRLQNR